MPAREKRRELDERDRSPNKLLSRMKKKSVKRYGTNRMKSWLPMMSRPIELRTKP